MSSLARQDLRGILDWTVERFREEAMRRYRNLFARRSVTS